MTTLHLDPVFDRAELLARLYQGDLALFTEVAAVGEFVAYARAELVALFAPHDPEAAHLHFTPAETAQMLGQWKPRFIHDERSRAYVRSVVSGLGFDPEHTYFDLPKPRTAFPADHLSTGIAFAFPWHRDTWYAAPPQQINWWFPVFDVRDDNAMKFDLESFGTPVANSSESFDYYELNRDRATTATQVKREVQPRPHAIEHDAVDEFVVLPRPGSILLFSGNQLHATQRNTSSRSRYSIDFRTVDGRDVIRGRGASAVDVQCTGTALRDFVGIASGERLPESLVRAVYGDPPDDAVLVFDDDAAESAARESAPEAQQSDR